MKTEEFPAFLLCKIHGKFKVSIVFLIPENEFSLLRILHSNLKKIFDNESYFWLNYVLL